jgi:glycine cleavage system transcriptional repressor
MHTYIVTVTAADRVGIVHSVTGTIRDLQGNILELSQTVMRGYFTIIVAVEFDEAQDLDALGREIAGRGGSFELTVAVRQATEEDSEPPVPNGERFILTVLGTDHPGNVHGISGCLTRLGVNIVDLHARVEGPRFSLVMEAFLPHDLSPVVVRAELARFGRDLGLEAFVQHENIFTATSEPTPVRVGPSSHPQGTVVVPH